MCIMFGRTPRLVAYFFSFALLGLVGLVDLVGCKPTAAPPPAPPSAIAVEVGPPAGAGVPAPACAEPTLPPSPLRDGGIDAFLGGRLEEAAERLRAAVAADPRDRAAAAFLAATEGQIAAGRAVAGAGLLAEPKVRLPPLPPKRTANATAALPGGTKVHLELQAEKKNLITDTADWITNNGLTLTTHRGAEGLPVHVAPSYGRERLAEAFVHPDHVAAWYHRALVVSAPGKRRRVFDVGAITVDAHPPLEIGFAELVGNTLVVAAAYNGYAKASGGKNGYVAAYDAASGALIWSSDPLVANANGAIVTGGSIVTGYGFTAEPDFLYVLDLAGGAVEQRVPLKTAPEILVHKGDGSDRVFVRGYNTDYVFRSTTPLTPAPAAALEPAGEASEGPIALSPPARCWMRRAVAGIAAGDAAAIREAAEQLKPLSRDRVLLELLRDEEHRASEPSRLDLAAAPLLKISPPPWQAQPGTAPPPSGPAPRLVKIATQAASPVRNMHPVFDSAKPWFIAPAERGALPPGAPLAYPSEYGQELLEAILPPEDRSDETLLVYGGRYLVALHGGVASRAYDFDAFRFPPRADPQWKEFADQPISYAQEQGGVLYVCNGRGSYAREVYGKKAFLSALDAASGKLLWRSPPLVCGLMFAIAGDYIVTGYGFTAEPDFVFLIHRADGKVVQKVSVDSAPDAITLSGNRVHVEMYGHVADFELR
jgi:outer membrane protein assembly factor BamB